MKDMYMAGGATNMGSLWAKKSFLLSPRRLRLNFSHMKRLKQFGVAGPTWWHEQVGCLKSSNICLQTNSLFCRQAFSFTCPDWMQFCSFTWEVFVSRNDEGRYLSAFLPEALLLSQIREPSHLRGAVSWHLQVTGVSGYVWAPRDHSAG